MNGTAILVVEPQEWLRGAVELRDSGYSWFDWLSAVDQQDAPERAGFDLVLHLYRPPGERVPLAEHWMRTRLEGGQPVASLTPVYRGAAWHERETFEMFGIEFSGFDDGTGWGLRRLLLPPEVRGHPLAKDFVLSARAVPPPGVARPKGRRRGMPAPPAASGGRPVHERHQR